MPAEWQFATALETASSNGGAIKFKPVSFDTLVDSPIVAGRYHDRFVLDGSDWRFAERRFFIDLVGDVSHHMLSNLPS